MIDVALTFAEAQRAFAGGDAAETVRLLDRLPREVAGDPNVLHLRALALKRSGRTQAARNAFEQAHRAAPGDPQIANNYANLLKQEGAHAAALALYDEAVAARPDYRDARFNKALLLQKLGRLEEALADLEPLRAGGPADAKVHSARASILFLLKRFDEAADAYDTALRVDPFRVVALHGRGRIAMERGEDGASDFYVRALQQNPGDLDLVLGLAEAFEAEGNPLGLKLLSDAVERTPEWITGHEILARMRSEAAGSEDFADHYRRALERRPGDRALHFSYWRSLARGERHGEALAALRAAHSDIGDDADLKLMEAVFVSESGDPAAALPLIALFDEAGRPDISFARGRIALRAGDATQAAEAFERVIRLDSGNIGAWAHVNLAWRLTGDARHEWLTTQPGLYGARELDLDAGELERLAEVLRGLHRTRAHPIGQSLRGGTQTRGRLFSRRQPEIVRLRDAIEATVAAHFVGLPPRDEAHPLLRHRDAKVRIEGSWSVRLTSQGFHVNHIHPEGILSSACYISLPETLGAEDTRDGWLELGRPPVELGLDLEPLAVIEPKPGRLALFPSYLFHGTRPFREGERLTVAFDVVPA